MNKQTIGSLKRQLERCKKNIALERDKMRDILDEYQAILETAQTAEDDIERAIDTLSQYL